MEDSTDRNSYMYIVVLRVIKETIVSVKIGVHLHYLLFDVFDIIDPPTFNLSEAKIRL